MSNFRRHRKEGSTFTALGNLGKDDLDRAAVNDIADLPGVKELWQLTLGDPSIRVAVLDGPVDTTHTCFAGAHLEIASPVGLEISDAPPVTAHGTHVASVIFGQHGSPVRGVTPGCTGILIPVYGGDEAGELTPCSQMDLARGLSQALQQGAHIINVSGGELTPTGEAESFLTNAVHQCAAQNVLIVAATGNEGGECLHVPAALPSVLAVGAADRDGLPLHFSNWDESLISHGVIAPGTAIAGAVPSDGVALKNGTSFANAIVTGVAALMLSAQRQRGENPDPRIVREAILASAVPCRPDEESNCHRMMAGRLNIPGVYARIFEDARVKAAEIEFVHASRVGGSPVSLKTGSKGVIGIQGDLTPPNNSTDRKETKMSMSDDIHSTQSEEKVEGGATASESTCGCDPSESAPLASNPGTESGEAVVLPQSAPAVQAATAPQPLVANPETAAQVAATPSVRPSSEDVGSSARRFGAGVRPAQTAYQSGDAQTALLTDKNATLVFALGELSYDFGTEPRMDYFSQRFGIYETPPGGISKEAMIPNNHKAMAHYLADPDHPENQADSNALIWTLNIDAVPVYALTPNSQFSVMIYMTFIDMLKDAADGVSDRVSIAGNVSGSVRLYNGTVVPVVAPILRGMFNWNTQILLELVLGKAPTAAKEKDEWDAKVVGIKNFLDRVYYQLRNMGQSPQDRAMNYMATNAYQVKQVFDDAYKEDLQLDTIQVEKSPICRPESDCQDVQLQFFNPAKRLETARKVYRQTVDVSDLMPVSVGPMRSWYIF